MPSVSLEKIFVVHTGSVFPSVPASTREPWMERAVRAGGKFTLVVAALLRVFLSSRWEKGISVVRSRIVFRARGDGDSLLRSGWLSHARGLTVNLGRGDRHPYVLGLARGGA